MFESHRRPFGAAQPLPEAGYRRRRSQLGFVAVGMLALAAVGIVAVSNIRANGNASTINERAAQVMPFDLSRTHHTFSKTDRGGVQTVVADDPADGRNVGLIRAHLSHEAAEFRKGNFSDPAKIHGMEMPGLQELEAGATRVDVRYRDVPDGGEITYTSDEPDLVQALHAWFDRQTSDHAMPGMGG
jgi:hypothetical protein